MSLYRTMKVRSNTRYDPKQNSNLKKYQNYTQNTEHRRARKKLRISDHILEIERGRYKKTYLNPESRICPQCRQMEDEKHFLTKCTLYKEKGRPCYGP